MNKAYKIKLYPNKEQQTLIGKTIGCCRFLYNQMLNERIEVYELLKNDKKELYSHKYKTEKQYKEELEFWDGKTPQNFILTQTQKRLQNK